MDNDYLRHLTYCVIYPILTGILIYSTVTAIEERFRGPMVCEEVYRSDTVVVNNCR